MAHFQKTYRRSLHFHGNSLLHLGNANVFYAFAVSTYVYTNLVSPKPAYFDYSYQGKTTLQLTSEFPTVVAPYVRSGDVLVFWEITNDLWQGQTPTQCVTNLKAYCSQAKALGLIVLVLTVIPRNNIYISESDRTAINSAILADTSFCDGVIDVASMVQFNTYSCVNDTTYYNADKVHLTTTGYNLIGSMILPIVQAYF